MHLYITARHFDLTPSIREHLEQRLVHAVQTHATSHDLLRMEVQLTQTDASNVRFRCHILLQLPEHHEINITEETLDLHEAIDRAEKRLIRKLTEDRHRLVTEKRHAKHPDIDVSDTTLNSNEQSAR
jgi:ribosomal subunit interface protein